jgi:glycosyltransferase involved in cell wall biosynthesis
VSGETPRIAVVIPCHDDGRLVLAAVRSIDEREPVEIAVADDHSSDAATLEALAELESEGVTVLRHASNQGPSAARMTGLRATRGRYVFALDADDLAVPGALEHMADLLDRHPEADVCFGDYAEFGDHELVRAVPETLDPFRLAYANEYPVSALFRREALEAVGGWRDVLDDAFGYEDWNLWMALAERGAEGVHAGPGVLTHRHRLRSGRLLGIARLRHREHVLALRRTHPRLFAELPALRRSSDLSSLRKLIYPILYSPRRRFGFELRFKRALDRLGVWTLRREG